MRKLIVSMNVTLDGFMSGANDELDWHFRYWSSSMAECLYEQLCTADTILLGKTTYMAMAQLWPAGSVQLDIAREDIAFIELMNRLPKVVVSATLKKADWFNSTIIHSGIEQEILKLKSQQGKNMIVYGSGKLVSWLHLHNLVDEYQLWLHPVVLGKGKPLFKQLPGGKHWQLCRMKSLGSGVVFLLYNTLTQSACFPEKG